MTISPILTRDPRGPRPRLFARLHPRAWSQRGRRAWTVGLLGLLVAHFAATVLYLHPISIVGLHYRHWVVDYMEPLFRQRWSLFAPDPPLRDHNLDYQCEGDDPEGSWRTRSEVLLAQNATFRVGPAGRLRRLEQGAIGSALGIADPVLTELDAASENAPEDFKTRVELLKEATMAQRLLGQQVMYRLVQHYCAEETGHEEGRVRYRVVEHAIVPYSKRNAEDWEDEARVHLGPWLSTSEIAEIPENVRAYLDERERELARAAEEGDAGTAAEKAAGGVLQMVGEVPDEEAAEGRVETPGEGATEAANAGEVRNGEER